MNRLPEELIALREWETPTVIEDAERRDSLVARINEMTDVERARERSRLRYVRWAGVAVLAATFPLGYLGVSLVGGGALVERTEVSTREVAEVETGGSPRESTLAPSESKERTRSIAVEQTFQLKSGAVVRASERAAYRVVEQGARQAAMVFLSAGKVSLIVPPLGDSSLTVRTPHTDVVVHGTKFSVSVVEGDSPRTQVEVTEGVVSVAGQEGQLFIRAGESWSSEQLANHPRPAVREEGGRPNVPAPPAREVKQPRGTLGVENQLYREAMLAKRSDQPALALQKLDELLRRFPHSPLVEAARTERSRIRRELER